MNFLRPTSATLALTAALGCTIDIKGNSNSGPEPETTDDPSNSGTTSETGDTTIDPPTTSEPTTGVPTSTTVETTTGTTADTDTGVEEPMWCNGFSPSTTELSVLNGLNETIVDGSPLQAECGGQGTLMIPIYPKFGGFEPEGDSVTFDVILDVDDFNLNPNNHFFETTGHVHEIECSQEEDTYYGGYSYSFIPMFPPDAIPDINAVNGKPGHLKLTLHTPQGDVPFEADIVIAAEIDECGYGGG